MLARQLPFAQSVVVPHAEPRAHLGQLPPQSTSDSDPFLIVSSHAGATHTFAVQTALLQSLAPVQVLVSSHLPQAPPQSMSDSSWFLMPSPQVGTWQVPPEQWTLLQSVSAPHP